MAFLFGKAKRKVYLQSADRMQVKLQAVIDTIRHDYPAAASDIADAVMVIGRLAAVISEGEGL